MNNKIKIAYISYFDSDIIKYWSGLVYFMRKSLEQANTEIIPIHNLESNLDKLFKLKSLYYKITNKNYERMREISINKRIARKAEKIIHNTKPDVILSSGSLEIAQIDTKIPLTFWADATFNSIVNYYPDYTNLDKQSLANGDYLEKESLSKSRLQFFASEWAAKDSINYYKSDPNKVKIIPFGANLIDNPKYEDIKININLRKLDKVNFLFVGVNWYRKGGDIATKIVEKLRLNGVNACLHVVGCMPNIDNLPEYIKTYGYLNKSNNQEYQKLVELYDQAHFFIMPSRYEAFGIVVSEANSKGLPVIGSKTGGLQYIIKNNINGFLFDYDNQKSSIEFIATQLQILINDIEKYRELCLSSYNEYSSNLNWNTSGQKIIKELYKII